MSRSLLTLCLLCLSTLALADTRLVYSGHPVTIILPVGKEIRVVFPEPVSIDIPSALLENLEATQANPSVAYFKALEPSSPGRLIVQSENQERVYLIDMEASEEAIPADYLIENPSLAEKPSKVDEATSALNNPYQVELTRFAAQTLYGPTRLAPHNNAIKQVPMPTVEVADLIRSREGETYHYRPVAAWRGWGHYVTAVEVINRTPLKVSLDPRQVRGDFDSIAFQHTWLGPVGALEDRTTVYLISDNPLPLAIGGLPYGQ
ncbi:TIGR03749 family integrating conjugative element protein [Gilvimarinus polysaccharolyticus]|uniref:TIGR03749 family integrating conjugative element protein n=1 Tax=Gilvimarinus polysaccharolyticus TaxID=863921 RepID=UPI000A024302|nr:TIGR03749 family integrating conjugative element protein [Gilvimarinus polysaccharolyticus]